MTVHPTETLTDEMIRALRTEAASAGDSDMVSTCATAFGGGESGFVRGAREACARAITDARAMDDSRPFVRVVP